MLPLYQKSIIKTIPQNLDWFQLKVAKMIVSHDLQHELSPELH